MASRKAVWFFIFTGLLVVVLPPIFLYLPKLFARRHAPTTKREVALTFDDGPNPPFTERTLEILAHYGIRATFFFIGRNIEMHRTTALAVVRSGHEVGNHSYSHERLGFGGPGRIRAEIADTDGLIRTLGYEGAIPFRAPFGQVTLWTHWILGKLGRTNFLYDTPTAPPDYFRPDPKPMLGHLLDGVRAGSVILLHDGEGIRTETTVVLEGLIPELLARGYVFKTVTELFGER